MGNVRQTNKLINKQGRAKTIVNHRLSDDKSVKCRTLETMNFPNLYFKQKHGDKAGNLCFIFNLLPANYLV